MGDKLISEEAAEKVQQKVVANILTKVREGKTPTAMEMSLLDKYTHSSDVGFSGTYAKNQTQLADLIGVDRKTIQRWRKDPTFPKPKADGRYMVSEVVEWKDASGSNAGNLTSKESAQVKSILLQNEKLEIQVGILKEEYTLNVDVDHQVAEMVQQAKRELLALPSSLAPQVIGQTVAEAEKIIKQTIVEALRSLHEGEWSNGEK